MAAAHTDRIKRIKFTPSNRYVQIFLESLEEEVESLVLLPEDYKKEDPPIVEAVLIEKAADCKIPFAEGDKVLVEAHMIREIKIEGFKVFLIQENYILGKYEL